MGQQTAIEWFIHHLKENGYNLSKIPNTIETAKQMEKEQIVNSWNFSRRYIDYPADGEKYYNETYGTANSD